MNDADSAYIPSSTTFNPDQVSTSGAVYLAKNFASQHNYTSVTSTLTYGCQWDAMCRYIGDSQRKTPTKDAPELTGSVSTDVSKNIYDLAGNCTEYTMEAYRADERNSRGGNYINAFRVSDRCGSGSINSFGHGDSFRPTLYIK